MAIEEKPKLELRAVNTCLIFVLQSWFRSALRIFWQGFGWYRRNNSVFHFDISSKIHGKGVKVKSRVEIVSEKARAQKVLSLPEVTMDNTASSWITPPARPELIENLVSGVGQPFAHFFLPCKTQPQCRPLQSKQCEHPGGLSLPPDPQRRIWLPC